MRRDWYSYLGMNDVLSEQFPANGDRESGLEGLGIGYQRALLFLEQHILNSSIFCGSGFRWIGVWLSERQGLGFGEFGRRQRDGVTHHDARSGAEEFFRLHRLEHRRRQVVSGQQPLIVFRIEGAVLLEFGNLRSEE